MLRINHFGLRQKVTVFVLLLNTLSLLFLGGLTLRQFVLYAEKNQAFILNNVLKNLQHSLELAVAVKDKQEIFRLASAPLSDPNIGFIKVYDTKDLLVSVYQNNFDLSKDQSESDDYDTYKIPIFLTQASDVALLFGKSTEEKKKLMGFAEISYGKKSQEQVVQNAFFYIINILFINFVFFTLIIFFTVRRWTDRLENLTRVAKDVSKGKYSSAIKDIKKADDELSTLAHSFNEMREAILSREKFLKEAKENADKANDLKSQFLANISHEIRTPASGILGLLTLLENTPLNESQKKQVILIRQSGNYLVDLMNELLDLAKLESGNFEINISQNNLYLALNEVFELVKNSNQNEKITFKTSISQEANQNFSFDLMRFKQIFLNLLGNSIKFTEEGYIELILKKVSENKKGLTVQIIVKDTGIGISKDNLPLIFGKFVTVGNKEKKNIQGVGLGLAISKQIIEFMGGSITVESVHGEGTSFFVSLFFEYVAKLEKAKISQEEIDHSQLSSIKILVAEDNEVNQIVIKGFLETIGVYPTFVWNGKEAVEAFEKEPFDIIFIDINMPFMGGIEATKEIRKKDQGKHKPYIVALTANAMVESREKYLNSQMDDFISKPIDFEVLKQLLFSFRLKKHDNS